MSEEKKLPVFTFASFSEEKARLMFGLKTQLEPEGYLDEWFRNAQKETITPSEEEQLTRLQRKLKLFVRGWNEQELRERFIIPVVEIVDFDMYDLEVVSFSEREMKVTFNKKIIQGKVEWMVANGLFEPHHPFFFIHVELRKDEIPIYFGKYKREKDSSNDPVGQLLATLATAQLLNNQQADINLFQTEPINFSHVPLYGIYIHGRNWFFVRLKDRRYYISKAYVTTDMEDLKEVLKMLKAQKKMIIQLIQDLELVK